MVVAALVTRPDVPVKIDDHPDKVGAGHAKVGQGEVHEDLPRPCPDAGDAHVGEDYKESTYHREKGHARHHHSQPDFLVLQRVDGAGVGGPVVRR